MNLFLGIDTSCYTTSLALVDSEGNLFCEERILLNVPQGGRGLAQNEAVFQHVNNLPLLFNALAGKCCLKDKLAGVAASTRPRPVQGSYMPVFKVAEGCGRSVASLFSVPFFETSHQEGHVEAGIWSAKGPEVEEFLAFHVSGGTTEILTVKKDREATSKYNIRLLGGSSDLHAGQFIDRVGVALGLPFPAGPHLEKLALETVSDVTLPASVKDFSVSFSGPETAAQRMIKQGVNQADLARAVEKCIASSLEKVINNAITETGLRRILLVGGVSSNKFIKNRLIKRLSVAGTEVFFAEPSLSKDNAVGVALIGLRAALESHRRNVTNREN